MKKVSIFTFILLTTTLAALLAGNSQAFAYSQPFNQQASKTRAFIDTWQDIHLLQDFDYNISNPTAVAARYDLIWGASTYTLSAWRKGNPNIFLTYYMVFGRDSGTFQNSAQHRPLSWWQVNHPDWILYQCDKKTPAYKFGEPDDVPIDFSNPAVVSWQVQTYAAPAGATGYDGLAADNVDLGNWYGACGVYNKKGVWTQLYTGQSSDAAWQKNIVSWLTQMHQAVHKLPRPLTLIPNMSLGSAVANKKVILQVIPQVDGLFEEAGFTNQGQGYLTDAEWTAHMSLIATLQAQGKPYYSSNQFTAVGQAQIQWALSSYLMAKSHLASIFISGYQQYGSAQWYPEYLARVGTPVGSMRQQQQVYWRTYTKGLVLVNPSSTKTYTITLPTGVHYVDLYKQVVPQQVTLTAHSGLVLLLA